MECVFIFWLKTCIFVHLRADFTGNTKTLYKI